MELAGNKKPKLIIPGVALAIVIVTFFLLATAYSRVQPYEDQAYTVYEDGHVAFDSLSRDLKDAIIALNYEMLLEHRGESFAPFSEIAQIRSYTQVDATDEEFYEISEDMAHRLLVNRVSDARRRLATLSSTYQISYFALHRLGGVGHVISSDHSGIHNLMEGTIDDEVIRELENEFAHVIVVRYNAGGRWDIPFILAPETTHVIFDHLIRNNGYVEGLGHTQRFPGMTPLYYNFDIDWDEYDSTFEWQNPRSTTFAFGIPHTVIDAINQEREIFVNEENIHHYSWHVFPMVRNARHIAFGLMIAFSLMIPLSKVKDFDNGYASVRKFPIEVVAFGTWVMWQLFVRENMWRVANGIARSRRIVSGPIFSNQNMQLAYFLGLLFIALCLLGYLVHYVKDMYHSDWKLLKEHSLLYKLYSEFLTVDLKKSQNLRIFILIFGQIFVAVGLLVFAERTFPHESAQAFVFVLVPSYLGLVFLYVRYKVAKIRNDYLCLFEITKELANGNLEVSTPDDLGYFDSLKDELTTIQDGFGRATQRAIANERMKGELITNVSHDLKTPLTSIITYVDLLQVDDLDDEKKKQYLNTLVVKTDRLKALVEDLFEVSKAATGNMKMDLMEVDVVTLMKQTLLGLEDRIVESGLTLKEGYPEEPVKLMLDGGRMHRVFENLIINMIKYAMPGTRAYIDITDDESQINIILRNMSAHELKHDMKDLAERFVRGDESRNTEGSGLGLAIAKSFVELQRGTFEIVVDGDLFKVVMTFSQGS